MLTQVENPVLKNSRFVFSQVLYLDISIDCLNLTQGNSHIPLPEWIAAKKAIINPKNEDEECFKWPVIAALHHGEIGSNSKCVSKLRKYVDNYDWSELKFPVSLQDINIFEKNNSGIQVNVLGEKGKDIFTLRRPKYNDQKESIKLLLISNGERKHYTAIKSMSRLLASGNNKSNHRQHECLNCLQLFNSKGKRYEHSEYCIESKAVQIEMPEKGSVVKFQDG